MPISTYQRCRFVDFSVGTIFLRETNTLLSTASAMQISTIKYADLNDQRKIRDADLSISMSALHFIRSTIHWRGLLFGQLLETAPFNTTCKHNHARTLVAAATGTHLFRWICVCFGVSWFCVELEHIAAGHTTSTTTATLRSCTFTAARASTHARVDARANTHKHTKTHSTLFLDTHTTENVAVAGEVVRSAKPLLRNVCSASAFELQQNKNVAVAA